MMTFTNSPLVSYTKISQNRTKNRNHEIDTITIHCVVGQCSVQTLGAVFASASRQASANYGIGYDGKIGMYCEEKDRSWCSSSAANDHRAITIEVASDTKSPYKVNAKAYAALIDLCTDICKRNNIKRLLWKADKSLIGQVDKQNMTVHRWFANKSCPGDYLYNLHSKIAEEVNERLGVNNKKTVSSFKPGDIVKITGKKYYGGAAAPSWVRNKNWVVYSAAGDRVVLDKSEDGKNSIMSPFKASDLALVKKKATKPATTTTTKPATKPTTKPTTTALKFGVGDIVQFAGGKHYASADAKSGSTVKASKAKITAVCSKGKHQYHCRAVDSNGKFISGVHGWVDKSTLSVAKEWKPAVGDIVNYTGKVHYANAGASKGSSCKGGKAKITQISSKNKHPYHLVAVSGGGSNVYGWVDAGTFTKA